MSISPYTKIIQRKRSWTPVQGDAGDLLPGGESTVFRALSLRCLELPVKAFLGEGLEKELPKDPGVVDALLSNQADEDKHDLALSYVVNAHGVDESAEKEAQVILQTWLDAPEHPILKASVLERSVFFTLLPMFRFLGDMSLRSLSADISRDEQAHTAIHGMVCHDLGIKQTKNLDRLRRATVAWVVDNLGQSSNKYLHKDFWIRQSDNLYSRGKSSGLSDTQRARQVAFFESSNINLPQYG